jgi:hypothetical protein
MIKNRIMFVFLAVFILSLVIPVTAQTQRRMTPYYDYPDLTEEQLNRIQELRLAFHKDILALRTELMAGYMELDNLYVQNVDQKIIENKLNKLDQMEAELDEKFAAYQQQVRNLLSDEQQVQFDRFGGLDLGVGGAGDLGMGYGWGAGRGYDRGLGMGYGWGAGRGYGRGLGIRSGRAWGFDRGYGRGIGINSRLGRNWTRGTTRTLGWNRDLGYNRSLGRNWTRGIGRGFRCPFFRIRRW